MPITKNRKLWVAQYDLSPHLKGLDWGAQIEPQDDTVFGDAARSNEPGLDDFGVQAEGLWSAGDGNPDLIAYEKKGLADVLATVAPVAGTEGSIAYFMRTMQGEYAASGAIGEQLMFSVSLSASGGIGAVRGIVAANETVAATGDGTAFELGAVSASQKLYAAIHVLSVSGTNPTLDVIVESDTEEAFGDSPSTRITFAEFDDVGSAWATPVSGAITDTWWRVGFTVGGTDSPEFEVVVVIGIQ